jgi:hypothetical protein
VSKKAELADLRVYLEQAGSLYRAVSLSVRRTSQTRIGGYEVYVENFHDILRGKDSIHSSGRIISRTTLVKRETYEWTIRVGGRTQLSRIAGISFGSARRAVDDTPNFPRSGESSKQGSRRLTAIVQMPEFQHGYEVFAVSDPSSTDLERLRTTLPYPKSVIAAVLVADWISPAIVLVVWAAQHSAVYSASESHRPETDSFRFRVHPAAYDQTWVQTQLGSPRDDILVHGFPHAVWPPEKAVDAANYYFARDGKGEMDRVVITATISQAAAEAVLAQREARAARGRPDDPQPGQSERPGD